MRLPPYHTAYLCRLCEMTFTSTPLDCASVLLCPVQSPCGTHLHQATALLLASSNSPVHDRLDVPLQPLAKVLEHGRSTRQHNVLVQASSHINRRGLDDGVDNLRQGREEVGRVYFGVEEDLGAKEPLVSDIQVVFLVSALILSLSHPAGLTRPVTLCSPANRAKYL